MFWIVEKSLASLLFIIISHHLFLYFQTTLTLPKQKDLFYGPIKKYSKMYETIKQQKEKPLEKESVVEKSAKWKNQSQAFREAMKAARDVSHAISTGAPLPPPTISAPDPSLIPCPHCSRRFNEKAAERHIPLCTSIKAKPTKLSKGGGLGASAGVSVKDKKKNSTW